MKHPDVDAYSYEISGPNGGEAFNSNPVIFMSVLKKIFFQMISEFDLEVPP
jgi:hypothetical protein